MTSIQCILHAQNISVFYCFLAHVPYFAHRYVLDKEVCQSEGKRTNGFFNISIILFIILCKNVSNFGLSIGFIKIRNCKKVFNVFVNFLLKIILRIIENVPWSHSCRTNFPKFKFLSLSALYTYIVFFFNYACTYLNTNYDERMFLWV